MLFINRLSGKIGNKRSIVSLEHFNSILHYFLGEHQVAAIDYGAMDSEDSTSNSVILDLEVNDQVWLQLYEGRELYSSHYRYTTFSGWLLFPAN